MNYSKQKNFFGKVVLVRADLNVPMRDGCVTDGARLKRFAPTVRGLIDQGAKVVVMTHRGRPEGLRQARLSVAPLVRPLSEAIGKEVIFVSDCIGEQVAAARHAMGNGDVLLLENLRFHGGEESNDKEFAEALAVGADAYINDAFSCAHRAHASTDFVASILDAYAGPLLAEEVDALNKVLSSPQRPVVAVVGGAKVSTKIGVLEFLLGKVDSLIIGGGMANTFIAAKGLNVGASLYEADALGVANRVMEKAKEQNCTVILPTDFVVAGEFAAHAPHEVVDENSIPAGGMVLDVGPKSVQAVQAVLDNAKTVLWNGPMGAFEMEPFDAATVALARHTATRTCAGALISVAGGGDTVAALNAANVSDDFSYVSSAGGAFLEWLEGKSLPGIEALR